jgi:hypothetical protein
MTSDHQEQIDYKYLPCLGLHHKNATNLLKGLSHELYWAFDIHIRIDIGLKMSNDWFLIFLDVPPNLQCHLHIFSS